MGDGELGAPISYNHGHRFNFGDREGQGPVAHHICERLQLGLRFMPQDPDKSGAHGFLVSAAFCDKVDQGASRISGIFELGYEGRGPNHLLYEGGGRPLILQWQATFYGEIDQAKAFGLGLIARASLAVPLLQDGSIQIDLPGLGFKIPVFGHQGSWLENFGLDIQVVGFSGVLPF